MDKQIRVGKCPYPLHQGEIYVPGEVRSSKNSKRILTNRKTGKPFIGKSKASSTYEDATKLWYMAGKKIFRDMVKGWPLPIYIEFTFVRQTKGRWDFNNITQSVQDMMVRGGWIEDDNVNFLLPVPPMPPNKAYIYDKEFPGVIIKPLKTKPPDHD